MNARQDLGPLGSAGLTSHHIWWESVRQLGPVRKLISDLPLVGQKDSSTRKTVRLDSDQRDSGLKVDQ